MSQSEKRLRPEAGSVWIDTLTPDQERAFSAVVGLIDAATRDLPDVAEWKRDPTFDYGLDIKRVSRVLLLGGGRGSGKTTVANTLQQALAPSDAQLFSRQAREDLSKERERLALDVASLREKVIVLEPLRLADAPPRINILAALLARIEQRLFPSLTQEDVQATTGARQEHDAVLDLLRLQTDVAIAWDGNLYERRGQLDPDNYAMEEMRVERVRLQLQDRFETVLRRIARDGLGHPKPALFLLIVDDVDVGPERLVELLRRLRLVGVSELLVLLVGDINPIETAFKMRTAYSFLNAAPGVTADQIGVTTKELESLTNLIGRSSLRKHLPYHQRVVLQPLRAREALNIKPLRTEGDPLVKLLRRVMVPYPASPSSRAKAGDRWTQDEAKKLQEMEEHLAAQQQEAQAKIARLDHELKALGESTGKSESDHIDDEKKRKQLAEELTAANGDCNTRDKKVEEDREDRRDLRGREPMNLARFVFPPVMNASTSEEQYWYVGSRILADSPRVAVDLWHALWDATSEDETELGGAPVHVSEDGVTQPESSALGLDSRLHTYLRQLAIERLDANCELWGDRGHPLSVMQRNRLLRDGDISDVKLTAKHKPKAPSITVRNGDADKSTLLCWRHEGLAYSVQHNPARRVDVGPVVVVSDLTSLEDRSLAKKTTQSTHKWKLRWVKENGQPWPIPMYRTIRQIEQFGYEWNAFLKSEGNRLTPARLAEAWVAIHTRVLLGYRPVETEDIDGDQPDHVRTEEAKKHLKDLLQDNDVWARDWLKEIAAEWLKAASKVLKAASDEEEDRDRLERWMGLSTEDDEVARNRLRALDWDRSDVPEGV